MRRLAALAIAAACGLGAAPAQASSLPPLDLRQGQGTVGVGFIQLAGDVAVLDGLALGLAGFGGLTAAGAHGRLTKTLGGLGGGTFGLMAAVGPLQSVYTLGYPTAGSFAALVGPVYESPRWWVRVRAALLPGVLVGTRDVYDEEGYFPGAYPAAGSVMLSRDTLYTLGLWPVIELVVPIGEHLELTLLGNQIGGLYYRW